MREIEDLLGRVVIELGGEIGIFEFEGGFGFYKGCFSYKIIILYLY